MTQNTQGSKVENLCENLLAQFNGELQWKWDGRFNAALAEFELKDGDRFRAVLEAHVGSAWDDAGIASAPEIVQQLAASFGGLMAGQLLFAADRDGEAALFCAWWPWGNGITVSIRIAPFQAGISSDERAEHTQQLKTSFGQ